MVTAIAAAILVSITAAVVLNLTWRRLELSAFRTDREIGLAAAEAGLRYAFARLDVNDTNRLRNKSGNPTGPPDRTFQQRVQDDPNSLIVSCNNEVPGLDHWEPGLHVSTEINTDPNADEFGDYAGGKHVRVRITFLDNPEPQPDRYEVRASADYGTGEP